MIMLEGKYVLVNGNIFLKYMDGGTFKILYSTQPGLCFGSLVSSLEETYRASGESPTKCEGDDARIEFNE